MKQKRNRTQRTPAATSSTRKLSPATRGVAVGAVAALLVSIVFFLVAGRGTPVTSEVVATPPSTSVALAPDFAVADLDGKVVRLSDLRGQPVVLNFWATWCPPCRAEIPAFIELQSKYAGQGLRIVGVAMDDAGAGAVTPFVKENAINYTVALPNREIVDRYGGVESLPTTFYIGRDGSIVQVVTGLIPPQTMEDYVRAAMAAPSQNARKETSPGVASGTGNARRS